MFKRKQVEEILPANAKYVSEEEFHGRPTKKFKAVAKVVVANVENPVEEKKESKKFSAWHVTLNPNVSFKGEDNPNLRPFCDAFARVLDRLLTSDADLRSVLVFNSNVKNRDIDYSDSECWVEQGLVMRRPHAHLFLQIRHNTNLQLGYKKLTEYIQKELSREVEKFGLPRPNGVYVHATFLKDWTRAQKDKLAILAYIRKNSPIPNLDSRDYHLYASAGGAEPTTIAEKPLVKQSSDIELDSEDEEEAFSLYALKNNSYKQAAKRKISEASEAEAKPVTLQDKKRKVQFVTDEHPAISNIQNIRVKTISSVPLLDLKVPDFSENIMRSSNATVAQISNEENIEEIDNEEVEDENDELDEEDDEIEEEIDF